MNKEVDSCKQAPGVFVPLIDPNKCEGKGPCVPACPYDVLIVGILPKEQRTNLTLKGKVKGFVHGWKHALLVNPDLCQACGHCVKVCPEKAITLTRSTAK
jgi:NAD-dependent dihydropyrimidine dehydrogenase PreA subunit